MQSILIIGKVWPESASSAAGSRMMRLINVFLKAGYRISFASTAHPSAFSNDLSTLGISTYNIVLNNSSFDSFIKELSPELVIFDRFTSEEQFGWRVAAACPNTLRILDTEDLHFLRAARQVALKEKRELNSSDLHSDLAKREIASMYRCDLSLIISNFEMKLLKAQFKIHESLLHYLPYIVNEISEVQKNALAPFDARQHFISIGNFLHEPNWDALLYLKTEIWPLIRKQLPKAELHNYGAYPGQKVFELNNAKEGFIIKGRAENVQTVMQQARICLAPLRFGAGIKGKLVDAMLAGTPSITTSLGAEAMHDDGTWGGAVKNTAQDFAEAAVHFYQSQSDWQQAQNNGFKILQDNFTNPAQEKELIDRIIKIQSDLEGHRALNFTGAMLMHHTTLSSRYMALWIEEKNKKQESQNSAL